MDPIVGASVSGAVGAWVSIGGEVGAGVIPSVGAGVGGTLIAFGVGAGEGATGAFVGASGETVGESVWVTAMGGSVGVLVGLPGPGSIVGNETVGVDCEGGKDMDILPMDMKENSMRSLRYRACNSSSSSSNSCLLYTSPSPRDQRGSRMPSSA